MIILACGGAKAQGIKTAIDLYLGRQFGEFRKRGIHGDLRTDADLGFDVMVLSAKHGLVCDWQKMADYDEKMTPARAAELTEDELQLFLFNMHSRDASEVHVYGGALYRDVIAAWTEKLADLCVTMDLPMPTILFDLVGEGRGCGDHYRALQGLLADLAEG